MALMRAFPLDNLLQMLTFIACPRFLEHPWSNLTTSFLNLEGASSGGSVLISSRLPVSYMPYQTSSSLPCDIFGPCILIHTIQSPSSTRQCAICRRLCSWCHQVWHRLRSVRSWGIPPDGRIRSCILQRAKQVSYQVRLNPVH